MRILCYGDSNTWGFVPLTAERYPQSIRWTGVMKSALGPDCEVVEEGLNGRTTVWDDPLGEGKNGRAYLLPCLETHKFLDLVILMLGTNDLKVRFSVTAGEIADGVEILARLILSSQAGIGHQAPRLLIVAPPPTLAVTGYGEMFDGGDIKSRKFATLYARVAQSLNCAFLDASQIIATSPIDGVHFEVGDHAKLGAAMAAKVRGMLFPFSCPSYP
jgi:lysophospholipase L1-like esterase